MKFRTPHLIATLVLATTLATTRAIADGTQSQTPQPPTVSISANGQDIRGVIHDLFAQVKQNYVIEPGVRFVLYLSLDKVDFDEALGIICHQAHLKADKQDGITYISLEKTEDKAEAKKPAAEKPKPPVTTAMIEKARVTTRLAKTDIRKVFEALADQSQIPIEVDGTVPKLRLDAFLLKTSLKYALDEITGAADLKYKFSDHGTVLVYKEPTNHVALVSGT